MKLAYRLFTFFILSVLAVKVCTSATATLSGSPIALSNDIQVRKVIDTGGDCVRLAVDPLTKKLYYVDRKANIFRLDVKSGNRSQKTILYRFQAIGGAEETSGMAFAADGTLYVVSNRTISKTTQAIIRKGVLKASGARTWSTLASTVPYPKSNTSYDHVFNGIVVSPDGRYVYVNSGSRTDHGEVQSNNGAFPDVREVPLTAKIFRIPTNSSNVLLRNDATELKTKGYLFADGVRNSYDPTFAPNGDLLAADNGPDADYTEEMNWLRQGHHYGFPWRMGIDNNPQQFPNYDPLKDRRLQSGFGAVQKGFYHNDPTFPSPPMAFTDPIANLGSDADQYIKLDGSLQDTSNSRRPIYTFTPHRSPLGLTFDSQGVLPKKYKGDAFILSWGAAEGNKKLTDSGQDLLHLKLTKVGDTYQLKATAIARSFNHPIDSAILNQKLYVLDYGGAGSIWEIAFSE